MESPGLLAQFSEDVIWLCRSSPMNLWEL